MFGRHSIDRRGIFWRREEGREGKRAMPRGEGEAQKKGKGLRFYGRPWLLLVGVRRRSHQPHLARCCCHCCLASSFSICAIVSSTIAECCARLVNSRRALSVLLLFHLCFLLLISSPHHPPLLPHSLIPISPSPCLPERCEDVIVRGLAGEMSMP